MCVSACVTTRRLSEGVLILGCCFAYVTVCCVSVSLSLTDSHRLWRMNLSTQTGVISRILKSSLRILVSSLELGPMQFWVVCGLLIPCLIHIQQASVRSDGWTDLFQYLYIHSRLVRGSDCYILKHTHTLTGHTINTNILNMLSWSCFCLQSKFPHLSIHLSFLISLSIIPLICTHHYSSLLSFF